MSFNLVTFFFPVGRIHHAKGEFDQAVKHLRQGLQIAADQNGSLQDEAKIRHRLGLALWAQGSLEEAQEQLYAAIDLFDGIRREAQFNNDYKLSLFDLQTASYQALQVHRHFNSFELHFYVKLFNKDL
jgi:tetratricopeptide (TPR) repeat protein